MPADSGGLGLGEMYSVLPFLGPTTDTVWISPVSGPGHVPIRTTTTESLTAELRHICSVLL